MSVLTSLSMVVGREVEVAKIPGLSGMAHADQPWALERIVGSGHVFAAQHGPLGRWERLVVGIAVFTVASYDPRTASAGPLDQEALSAAVDSARQILRKVGVHEPPRVYLVSDAI